MRFDRKIWVFVMNKYLASFADRRLKKTLERLRNQAIKLNYFDDVFLFDENNLDRSFFAKYRNVLHSKVRGFGYWCWKPQVILQSLEKMNDGDGLIYVDAGCHLNYRGIWRLDEYFEFLKESDCGIVAFQSIKPSPELSPLPYDGRVLFDQPNYRWIKGDLFDYFGVRHQEKYTHAQMIGAGVILVRKCALALSIINEWLNIIEEDFSLIDDSPSSSPNINGFIEHRHDQSIFTLLCIKHNVPTLSAYEYWYPKLINGRMKPDWNYLKNFPVLAKRDKDYGFVGNFINLCKKIKKKFGSNF